MKRTAVLLLALLLATPVLAAVPTTINYQGHLSASGGPASGLLPFHFSIYDAESGGNLLWADLDTLDVVNGLFSAPLGANTAIPTIVFNVLATWLETAVNGQVLAPRIPFASVPYAQFAQHADTANVAMSYSGTGQWASDGANVWRGSGKVGVGTATPDQAIGLDGMLGIYPHPWTIPTTKGMFLFHDDKNGSTIYSYDYPQGHGDTLGLAAAAIGFDTYGADGLYSGNKVWISQEGRVGIGTVHPDFPLDIQTTDPAHGLRYLVTGDSPGGAGCYVILATNDSRGALFLGNNSPWGGAHPADNAGLLETTGGWQWNKQLNIMGNVGINTTNTTSTLTVNGTAEVGGSLGVGGNLNVTGTKCRIVTDTKYGTLYYNAVESGHAIFTTSERAQLVNGKCHVELNPKWLAGVTIDERHPLDVSSVVFYGPHGDWYVIPGGTGFDVIDPSGTSAPFVWTVQARQKGYEDAYLSQVNTTAAVRK